MPEHRGREYHRERLREALREEIWALLEGELRDPRIGLASVNDVLLAPNGKSVDVLIAVEGDEEEARQTMEGLNAATGFIRYQIGERLRLRRSPELVFRLDRSGGYQARVEELLKRVEKRKKRAEKKK
ncbi:MAG TPA: 30S ribosome-binding factor RbfA [Terriglobales bacterium]|nr:30S ribosome-binding factor RbfA [Terriglobales bacterium]